jgi:SAM-dependent methyltransferase
MSSGEISTNRALPVSNPPAGPTQSNYHHYYEADEFDLRKVAYLKKNILPLLSTLPKSASILEVGPGRGALLTLLRSAGFTQLFAFEVCTPFADALARQGFAVSTGPSAAEHLRSLPANSLDALVLVDVLEHFQLEDGLEFLRESRRVVRPEGRLIIQTPNASGVFGINTFVADPTHATPWNELRLTAALRGSGFQTVNCHPMRLPPGIGNAAREVFRRVLFFAVRLLTRICGATPVRVLTHNLVCEAQ